MKITYTWKSSKRKYYRTKLLEAIERDKILGSISSYLFSYRAKHYGLDNLCPMKLYNGILNLHYCERGDFFLESYPDKSFELALNDLSVAIYILFDNSNIEELKELEIQPEEIKDVLLIQFMSHYGYSGSEYFEWGNVLYT